jgi:hypothetical protein
MQAQTATNNTVVQEFIVATKSTSFNGSQAIKMLQMQYKINYRSRKASSQAAALEDKYILLFFLNLLMVIIQPLRPNTQLCSYFFNNITISFKN